MRNKWKQIVTTNILFRLQYAFGSIEVGGVVQPDEYGSIFRSHGGRHWTTGVWIQELFHSSPGRETFGKIGNQDCFRLLSGGLDVWWPGRKARCWRDLAGQRGLLGVKLVGGGIDEGQFGVKQLQCYDGDSFVCCNFTNSSAAPSFVVINSFAEWV